MEKAHRQRLFSSIGQLNDILNNKSRLVRIYQGEVLNTVLERGEVDWTYQGKYFNNQMIFVDKKVAEIADEYECDPHIKEKILPNQSESDLVLFHDTLYRAIPSILESGGLYSSAELRSSGKKLLNGERIFFNNSPLNDVFAHQRGIHSGYVETNYWGDNVATLIINENRHSAFLKNLIINSCPGWDQQKVDHELKRRLRKLPERPRPSEFSSSEEFLTALKTGNYDNNSTPRKSESYLGPWVPLANIDAIAVPFEVFNDELGGNFDRRFVREAAWLVNERIEKLS